jgi:DNA-binding FrmR family transcriptional regulator
MEDALGRLRRISGQVDGLTRMPKNGRPVPDALVQFNAAEAALHSASSLLFHGYLKEVLEDATGREVADQMAVEVLSVFEGMRPK